MDPFKHQEKIQEKNFLILALSDQFSNELLSLIKANSVGYELVQSFFRI